MTNIEKAGKKIFAFFTWRLNRFGNKEHNNKKLNKEYFEEKQNEITKILNFLEDEKSKTIYKKCLSYRVSHSVRDQPDYNKKNQYFPKDIIRLTDHEVFVDCGAYNGDTIREFLKQVKEKYRKIIAFEPSRQNRTKIGLLDQLYMIDAGVWSCDTELKFLEDGDGSKIVEHEESGSEILNIKCKALDSCQQCEDATFIKMDIEGAELEGLKGAEKIIKKNKPSLAICIYHTPWDMVEIPLYLYTRYPEYKFYIRHHSHRCSETVLYAVP